jgi:tetratricopeptide (TPR) repeat protein
METPSLQQDFDRALQHHRAGQLPQAEAAYRQILAKNPRHWGALNYLGVLATQVGKRDIAVDFFRQSIAINPNWAEAHYNLGNALCESGKQDEAIAAFRNAVALKPHPHAYCNLGFALRDKGQTADAIMAYRQAIAIKPQFPEAYYNLGNALYDIGQMNDATVAFRQAIAFEPRYPEAFNNLGNVLRDKGQLDEAIEAYHRAIAIKPEYHEALSNLGQALRGKGQLEESIAACRRAIAIKPDFAEAHSNLASALLLQGDLTNGLKEYEWRWKVGHFTSPRRNFSQPQWDGSDLKNRTLLIHAEQGFGDTIQFIRYATMAAERGGHVVVECHPELKALLQMNARSWKIIGRDEPLPMFDVHCPMLSLPLMFGTTLQNIPLQVPTLCADSDGTSKWREKMSSFGHALKVGLVWAGNPAFRNDALRSPGQLSLYSPLSQVKNVRFFSLQKGNAAQQTGNPPPYMNLVDFSSELHHFTDTAAMIANLDLVISSDTAVAHLAGAMGKPVWVLLSYVPDWRWLRDREDCPWYPTMRLFRQSRPGDWHELLQRVARSLATEIVPMGYTV